MSRSTMPVASVIGIVVALVSARTIADIAAWPTIAVWATAFGVGFLAAVVAVFAEGVIRSLRGQANQKQLDSTMQNTHAEL